MKLITLIYSLSSCFLLLVSCDNLKDQSHCTDIFKTTYITIENLPLDDFYTLRVSNKDTIRADYQEGKEYPVLSDQYQDALENSKDSFLFVGIIQDSIVLTEPFVFSADRCHIHYISGNKNP